MIEKQTTNREALSRCASLVRPALAQKEYIPAYTHILFNDGWATAYNDVAAVAVKTAFGNFNRCIPGELLIKALASFGGDDVLIEGGSDGLVHLKSGKGHVKVPTLPAESFPFVLPPTEGADEFDLQRSVVKAIERCLLSVGGDNNHPATMGVTLDAADGLAVLYSTDNVTVSRCATDARLKLPGDAPVILPRFFCEQLVSLSKSFPEEPMFLVMHGGALQVDFGDAATLFTKTPVDLTPLDFPRIFSRTIKLEGLKAKLAIIPNEFDASLNRAALVTAGEIIRVVRIRCRGEAMTVSAESAMGQSDDDMTFDNGGDVDFESDASLLARGAKAAALIGFTDKATVMSDAECRFVHLVAHLGRK